MRFYHLTDEEVLDLPVERFWLLEGNIDRLRAEEDLRAVRVAIAAQAQNSSATEALASEMGTVIVQAPKRDANATARLLQLGGAAPVPSKDA